MKIVEKCLPDIKPYDKNPRKNDNAVEAVASSIREFGFKVPIVIDSDGVIVAGHTRYKAARKLELKTVPCIIADDLTPDQIKAFRLADNKTGELAEWDSDLLGFELGSIELDMTEFGFDLMQLEEPQKAQDDNFDIDGKIDTVCKSGEVWQLGEHRLICGDSTYSATITKLMSGAVADLVITDPPYNVNYVGKTAEALKIQNDKMSGADFLAFLTTSFKNMFEALKDGGSFYIWYASSEHINFETAVNRANAKVHQQLIWAKNSFVLGRQDYHYKHEPCLYGWKEGKGHYFTDDRTQSTVIEEDKPLRSESHPTMKPIKLLGKLINNSSKPRENVLDIFGGSGSTLIACEQLGRVCYMAEIDPKYCDVIIARWEKFTDKKAVKIMG